MSSIYGPRPIEWQPTPTKQKSTWSFGSAVKSKAALFGFAFAAIGSATILYSSAATGISGQIAGMGKCLDIVDGNRHASAPVQLWQCDHTPQQAWSMNKDGSISTGNSWCLDAASKDGAPGAAVELNSCSGSGSQRWVARTDSTLMNAASGLCLTSKNNSSANGSRLWLQSCTASTAQLWVVPTMPAASPVNGAATTPGMKATTT